VKQKTDEVAGKAVADLIVQRLLVERPDSDDGNAERGEEEFLED